MSAVNETHFFFNVNERRLYGFLHEAVTPGNESSTGVVFLDPWGEEKVRNHRLLVNLARYLARQGIHVLRFDFFGYGDSEGDFEAATPESMISDTAGAMDLLARKTGAQRIGLFGPRFGGAIAAQTALMKGGVDFLILLDPILDGYAYFYKLLRSNLTSQMLIHQKVLRDRDTLVVDLRRGEAVNIDGYLLGADFFKSAEKLSLWEATLSNLPLSLLIEVSSREAGRDQSLARFKSERLADRNDISHIKLQFPLFWEGQKIYHPHPEPLQELLTQWLGEHIKPEQEKECTHDG